MQLNVSAAAISDRGVRHLFTASAVRVGPRQRPKLDALWSKVLATFDWPQRPQLYVTQTPIVNAMAVGFDDPFVVVHSATLKLLDREEQRDVLAHELGHIISGHVTYSTIAQILLNFGLSNLPWLAEVARKSGARWIATGHTANDQAETILHRLLRGAGLKGLRGIAEQRPLAEGVNLIRPMLGVTRTEVVNYLQVKGQAFRQDSSNFDRRLTRNRIRHELLPLLRKKYQPALDRIILQSMEIIGA